MLATTLVSVGCYLLWFAFRHPIVGAWVPPDWLMFSAWFGGGAFIGAGLLAPFRRPWIGVCIGLAFQLVMPLVLAFFVLLVLVWTHR